VRAVDRRISAAMAIPRSKSIHNFLRSNMHHIISGYVLDVK
jgi:hypothetical protein